MISRAKTIKGSSTSIAYQTNETKTYFNAKYNIVSNEPRYIQHEMKIIAKTNQNIPEKPFLTAFLSFDRTQSDKLQKKDLIRIAENYAKKMGFFENQWLFSVHNNTDELHIHFYANRVGFDGKNTVEASNIGKKAGIVANQIAKEEGFKIAKEIAKERKKIIKDAVHQSLKKSSNIKDFVRQMDDRGYIFQVSTNVNGFNGGRIIPKSIYKPPSELSKKARLAKQGYKLSDCGVKSAVIKQALQLN